MQVPAAQVSCSEYVTVRETNVRPPVTGVGTKDEALLPLPSWP